MFIQELEEHVLVRAAREFATVANNHRDARIDYYDAMKGPGQIAIPESAADWSYIRLGDGFRQLMVSWGVHGMKPAERADVYFEPASDDPQYLMVTFDFWIERGRSFDFYVRLHASGKMSYRTESKGDVRLPAISEFVELLGINPMTFDCTQAHAPQTFDPSIPVLSPDMASTEQPFNDDQAKRLAEYIVANMTGERWEFPPGW